MKRRGWDMQIISILVHLHQAEGKTTSEALHTKKLYCGFLNQEALYKRQLVAYREYGLTFHDIACRTDRNSTTVIQIWNQWIVEGRTKPYAGSPRPREQTYCEVGPGKSYRPHHGPLVRKWPCLQLTVRRRLQQRKLSVQRSLQFRERRLVWCTGRQNWTHEWHNVFSDESRFYVQYSDGRMRVWRHREYHS
ncbi:hypothetical protein TNCV_560261 [Trichonephila clavipes]|nr:hypothetical protein TNCV_560261 [Trichonephila clavipes]